MSQLIDIDKFSSFKNIRDFPLETINDSVLETVRSLNEKTQLEPFIRSSIYDVNETPHGPVEIVDILTTKISYNNQAAYGAFIIKGKSFKTINAQDVAHQIYRIKKIDGLQIAIFAFTGNILDQPQEQFVATCNEINCDYSIWNVHDISRLLVSQGFICPRDGRVIEGSICECGYNPKRSELNLFQEQAIKELKTSHQLKQKAGLVILPTGSGKTRVAASDIVQCDAQRVLYIAHTHEILKAAQKEFQKFFGKEELKHIHKIGGLSRPRRINFISIQLLQLNSDKVKGSHFDYVIIDEFHHAAAKSYLKAISAISADFLLGLTATPFRSDRKDISDLCGNNIVVNYELRDGIDSGILSPYHYYGCFDDVDYSKIKHNGISYDIRDLEKALIIPKRDEAIISKWKEKALNKPSLGFCCSHVHAERCKDAFNKNGIPSEVYASYTSEKDRVRIISDFEQGKIKIIFTVDVFNEGVDFPFVECIIFLRPTESKRIFLQQLGRGLRRFHGKSHTLVLDFIGNFSNAYKVYEYFGLSPFESEEESGSLATPKTFKQALNLPLNCEIFFDEKVINLFTSQIQDTTHITRHNIYKILIHQYIKVCIKLGKRASWKDIDRNCLIDSSVYKILFKNIKALIDVVESELTAEGIMD